MNYYPFHIGDYRSHAAHLTLLQDLAYRRLLDLYYLHEEPLPADPALCARRIGMSGHLDDVMLVLEDFFVLDEAGYRNKRCDEVLEKFISQREKAQKAGIESGKVRRAWAQLRESRRTAGVRPPKNDGETAGQHPLDDPSTESERPWNEPSTESERPFDEPRTGTEHPLNACSPNVQATNNQEPITKNQRYLKPLAPSPLPVSTPAAGMPVDNSASCKPADPPPEPAPSPPPDAGTPPVVLIPLQGRELFGVDQAQIDAWRESYPAVDVLQTLRHIREWCLSNPARKKTRKGVRAFVTSWLAREQDSGGRTGGASLRGLGRPLSQDSREATLARLEGSRFCTVNQLNYREGVDEHGRIVI